MKRTLFLCTSSALLGAFLAIGLSDTSEVERPSVAQEPSRPLSGPGIVYPGTSASSQPTRPLVAPTDPTSLTPEERVNIAVYEQSNRSVVNIDTKTLHTDSFFGRTVPSEGAGSGVVLDREGHVLTNFHVIEGAREVRVTLYDGKPYDAQLVGFDPPNDVAVLKIDAAADTLHPVVLGESSGLRVGQRVFAIGNPFGLERTLTTGIISSLNRSIDARGGQRKIKQIIQIDAAINPGNSGGALLDTGGRMIGMTTAIASRTGQSAGVAFASPVNTIARIVPELIENGRIVRPEIGIAQVYQTEQGLMIASLVPGGAAERAGLKGPQVVRKRRREGMFVYEQTYIDRSTADLIIAVDGTPTQTADEFLTAIEKNSPGDQVTVTVVREGSRVEVPVVLDADE